MPVVHNSCEDIKNTKSSVDETERVLNPLAVSSMALDFDSSLSNMVYLVHYRCFPHDYLLKICLRRGFIKELKKLTEKFRAPLPDCWKRGER